MAAASWVLQHTPPTESPLGLHSKVCRCHQWAHGCALLCQAAQPPAHSPPTPPPQASGTRTAAAGGTTCCWGPAQVRRSEQGRRARGLIKHSIYVQAKLQRTNATAMLKVALPAGEGGSRTHGRQQDTSRQGGRQRPAPRGSNPAAQPFAVVTSVPQLLQQRVPLAAT
jgi:hypothetical protein